MFDKAFIPYKGYWSSPFCRWQGLFQNENSGALAAATTRRFFELRGITPDIFDGLVYGATIPQRWWFYDAPHFATLIGNPSISGPRIAQACATLDGIPQLCRKCHPDGKQCQHVGCDLRSNLKLSKYYLAQSRGPGGKPEYESWMMDGFGWDSSAETSPTGTADNVARQHGVTREESDAVALDRYQKYTNGLADDRAFQKRYMIPVEIRLSKKKSILVEEDEGITPCTAEGLANLKPDSPDSVLTFGSQTHPADGNAGMIVTTKETAQELSADKSVTIQILSYGFARTKKAHMPEAPTPAAVTAMERAGIKVADLWAVKTHNPFTINDIVMRKKLGIDDKIFNNYGSSLIFGHPQGPTTMRLCVELIEELVQKGGGYGLLAGCAAGDSGAALVIKVK